MVERGYGLRRTQTTMVPADGIFDVDCSTVDGMLESGRSSFGYPQLAPRGRRQRAFALLKKFMPSHGIVVKSRQGLETFGEGLPAEELRYLKWIVTNALVGRER